MEPGKSGGPLTRPCAGLAKSLPAGGEETEGSEQKAKKRRQETGDRRREARSHEKQFTPPITLFRMLAQNHFVQRHK